MIVIRVREGRDIVRVFSAWKHPNLHKGKRGGYRVWCSTIKEHPHWLHQSLWQTRWAFVTKRVSDVTLSCMNILRLSVVFIIASGYIYPSSRSQAEILASQMFIESTCICQQAQLCLQTHLLSMMCVLNFCDLRSMQCHITSHTRSRSSPSFEKVGKIQNTTIPA